MSRRIAGVFAHPDDDTYGVGGSLALHADDPDLRVTVIMTTSGDAGRIAAPSLATPAGEWLRANEEPGAVIYLPLSLDPASPSVRTKRRGKS